MKFNQVYQEQVLSKVKGKKEYKKQYGMLNDKYQSLNHSLSESNDYIERQNIETLIKEVVSEIEVLREVYGTDPDFSINRSNVDTLVGLYQTEVKPIHEAVNQEYVKLIAMLDEVANQYDKVLGHQYQAVVLRSRLTASKNLISNPDNARLPDNMTTVPANYITPGTMENTKNSEAILKVLKAKLNYTEYHFKGEK
ncbi:hypothetical protein [Corticicoccus populi]|uniref:Uncharacterized protein n=1 Tax=Corticicoccus populi TaxID=1812821 RepID=A0ABW5WWS9_9STAP